LDIDEFDFELPPSAIAQEPLAERDASRLLVLNRATGRRTHRTFRELPDLLERGDLLVLNRSRVRPARLRGRRAGGGAAEVLLVHAEGGGSWQALVRPGRRLRPGASVDFGHGLEGTIGEPLPGEGHAGASLRRVQLRAADGDLEAALERCGGMPLPPYIRRLDGPRDRERYQTVYAREPGSIAAPTAGLHFSPDLLERLAAKGVARAEVVLHVGLGTFQPVRARRVEDHRVPAEAFLLPAETADAVAATRRIGGRIVAVGTTTTRVLETCATGSNRLVEPRSGVTTLVVVPGYEFRVVDALVTNFHLPKSSLVLLAAAFSGRHNLLTCYAEALAHGYRFYSYGDAMLIA
jgi:S-adenosylmethionine:tRNA ribosyltransferase-isomerase